MATIEKCSLGQVGDAWGFDVVLRGLTLTEALELQAMFLELVTEPENAGRHAAPVTTPPWTPRAPFAKVDEAAVAPAPACMVAVDEVTEPVVKVRKARKPPAEVAADLAVAVAQEAAALDTPAVDEPVEPPPARTPLRTDFRSAPPVEPPPAVDEPTVAAPLLAGALGDTELTMRLADAPKLRDVIQRMNDAGIQGTAALVETATRIKDRVPVLSRIGDLKERITRAAEVLGVA